MNTLVPKKKSGSNPGRGRTLFGTPPSSYLLAPFLGLVLRNEADNYSSTTSVIKNVWIYPPSPRVFTTRYAITKKKNFAFAHEKATR
jgi:hypothetical protein